MKHVYIFLLAFISFSLQAEIVDSIEKACLLQLLPNLPVNISIEPAIPEDFVALPCMFGTIIWGPKKAAQEYVDNLEYLISQRCCDRKECLADEECRDDEKDLDDKKFPSQPLIQVAWEYTNKKEIFELDEGICASKNEVYPSENMSVKKYHWGRYPVVALQLLDENDEVLFDIAVVDVQSSHAACLSFRLVCPEKKDPSYPEAVKMWKHFLENTTELPKDSHLSPTQILNDKK